MNRFSKLLTIPQQGLLFHFRLQHNVYCLTISIYRLMYPVGMGFFFGSRILSFPAGGGVVKDRFYIPGSISGMKCFFFGLCAGVQAVMEIIEHNGDAGHFVQLLHRTR